jgi:membrane-associated phospholipid phosphatase
MPTNPRLYALAALAWLAACGTPSDTTSDGAEESDAVGESRLGAPATRDAVLHWNAVATAMVGQANVPAPLPPAPEALFYAMTFGAMHDALNAIHPRFDAYAFARRADAQVDAPSAVAAAAHGVLAAVATGIANDPVFPNPRPLALVESEYAAFLATRPDGSAKSAAIALGEAAAGAMLARRANDGSAGLGLTPVNSPGTPGAYRPTPPFLAPDGISGVADAPTFGSVRTFVVPSGSTFRAPAPYGATDPADAVRSARYTLDYAESRSLGGATSARTPEQTAIAFYWIENSPLGWNRVARLLGAARRLDAWRLARLLALVQFAEADAYITSFDSKYHWNFWRPVTAIRLGASDGNAATDGDPSWDVATGPFGIPTPPVPEYPSAHAAAGGAAEAVIASVIRGPTGFTMESASLPGTPRTFASLAAAAAENALSRVYVGYHFRLATEAGLEQGRAVGAYVASRALGPRD